MEIDLFLSFYLNNESVYGILYAEMGEVSMKQISITKISEEKNKKLDEVKKKSKFAQFKEKLSKKIRGKSL